MVAVGGLETFALACDAAVGVVVVAATNETECGFHESSFLDRRGSRLTSSCRLPNGYDALLRSDSGKYQIRYHFRLNNVLSELKPLMANGNKFNSKAPAEPPCGSHAG